MHWNSRKLWLIENKDSSQHKKRIPQYLRRCIQEHLHGGAEGMPELKGGVAPPWPPSRKPADVFTGRCTSWWANGVQGWMRKGVVYKYVFHMFCSIILSLFILPTHLSQPTLHSSPVCQRQCLGSENHDEGPRSISGVFLKNLMGRGAVPEGLRSSRGRST